MGRMLASSAELIPSQEGAEMAAAVSHILEQTQNTKEAFKLAKVYATENELDEKALKVAIAQELVRRLNKGHEERVASTRARLRSIGEDSRKFDQTMDGIMSRIFNSDRLSQIKREANSIPVPFKVAHAHGRGH